MITGKKILDKDNNGEYIIYESGLVENVNPIEYFKEFTIASTFGTTQSFLRKSIAFYNLPVSDESINKKSLQEGIESWQRRLSEIENTNIPNELILAIMAKKKKDQEKALRGVIIDSDILLAFIFKAWGNFGYKFSRYISEHYPNNTESYEMPLSAYLNKGKIEKIGETNLTDGQIKQVIENRNVIVANFFDNETNWFCLFVTYDSLKGKEGWKNGTPHYHFISDKFGLSKEYVIEQLRSKQYKLGSLPHIEISGTEKPYE